MYFVCLTAKNNGFYDNVYSKFLFFQKKKYVLLLLKKDDSIITT